MTSGVDVQLAARLVRLGWFSEAFHELSPCLKQQPAKVDPRALVLLAEVLTERKTFDGAESMVHTVLENPNADRVGRTRVLITLGRIRYATGLPEQSNRILADAERLAMETGDVELICRARFAELGTVADSWPRPVLAPQVDETRRRVLASGDQLLLAELHKHLARFEALAGNFDVARRHLSAGSRLFESETHPYLAALFSMTAAGVCSLASEHELGLAFIRDASKHLERSGNLRHAEDATATAAWFLLHLGRLDEAELLVRSALQSDPVPASRASMLDTLTNITLAAGRTEEATELAQEMTASLGGRPSEVPSYYQLSCQASRIRTHLRRNEWSTARRIAEQAVSDALVRNEGPSRVRFRLLLVGALIGEGGHVAAVDHAIRAACDAESLTGGHRAQLDRVLGLLLETLGQHGRAERYLARSVRISRSSGNAWANLETEPDHARVAAIAGAEAVADPADVVAAMLQLAPQADLLAYECVDLLRATGCAEATEMVSIGQDGDAQVVPSDGSSSGAAPKPSADRQGTVRIPTGERGGRRFEVLVTPKDDLPSRLAVVNASKIVEAALELERLRQAERERASLWPQDDIADNDAGVFVSTEMTGSWERRNLFTWALMYRN